jgi:drug/metabolite transporter (DMT)-like permease
MLTASATFATSGVFGTALGASGWSAAAALTIRLGVATALLTAPALLALRGRPGVLRRNARRLMAYGTLPIAAGQVAYFNSLQRMDVGVALLVFNLGIFWVVGWMWVRHGHRPSVLVGVGGLLAIGGVALVLDVGGQVRVDGLGLGLALAGSFGLAMHYVLPANAGDDLPPVVMAWAGLGIGSVSLLTAGTVGVVPFVTSTADVALVGRQVGWVWPLAGLALLAGVVPYVTIAVGSRLLGARLSAFVGLTEMLFGIFFAWVLLGQSLTVLQLVGAVLTVGGIGLVRYAETPQDGGPASIAA